MSYRNRNTRLRYNPAKGYLTDQTCGLTQEGVLLRELTVSIPLMVVTCTCLPQTCIMTAIRREPLTRDAWKRSRVNPLPQTQRQLNKA